MELGLSGLASGFDWRTLVEQLSDIERVPQRRLLVEQNTLDLKKNAYSSIATQLGILQNRVTDLKDGALYDSRLAESSDTLLGTALASKGAALGSYSFNVSQLATASTQQGASNVGASISPTNDVSGLVLSDAALALPITGGTFTVNGKQVTIDTTDTLQGVFDKISTATGGAVTGSYDSANDQVTLSAASEIVLGSTTDTSNVLQSLKLHNNGTGTITSASALGTLSLTNSLDSGNFSTAVSDGGSGAGEFKINGVSISFDAAADSLTNVIDRINNSAAGVTASYDAINDRVLLTNKSTGDIGMGLEDVTGNFLAASGLSSGTLERGNNLLYTVNGGGQLVSQSNTISSSSSSITGLSVTALDTGTFNVTVASDTAKIKTAITDFIDEYNKSQSLIDSETASSTDGDGVVTGGDLLGEFEANDLSSRLRNMLNAVVSGVSGSLNNVDSLGITSNGTDDTITLSNEEALDDLLANNLSQIKDLFSNATDGLAVQFDTYLEATAGEEGLLANKQDTLTRQISEIDVQITEMERLVLANEEQMIEKFIVMEEAQSRINQQLNFLLQRFGGS